MLARDKFLEHFRCVGLDHRETIAEQAAPDAVRIAHGLGTAIAQRVRPEPYARLACLVSQRRKGNAVEPGRAEGNGTAAARKLLPGERHHLGRSSTDFRQYGHERHAIIKGDGRQRRGA